MTEHAFANFIRILGKGKNGARSLTEAEAYDAMKMIYCYEVEPEQIGAFLMLMRVKEETAEEVTGFVRAIRESIAVPESNIKIMLDWPSYAGKRRQLPWYLLAAMTLGRQGYPVLMHGMHRDDERIYTRDALQALGVNEAFNFSQVNEQVIERGFSYIDIENFSEITASLISIRNLLGLRPPLHTVARMLNPMKAEVTLQSVFHPNYAVTHQLAAQMLEEKNAIAFKGEGGEIERIPERAVSLYGLSNGQLWEQQWSSLLPPGKYGREQFPDWDFYKAVWAGDISDDYSFYAITGTIALVLKAMNVASDPADAQTQAENIWNSRFSHDSVRQLRSEA